MQYSEIISERNKIIFDLEMEYTTYSRLDPFWKNDIIVLMTALRTDGYILEILPKKLRNHRHMVRLCMRNGDSFKYAPKKFRKEDDFIMELLNDRRCRWKSTILPYASEICKDDEDFMFSLIQKESYCVRYISKRLQNNKKLIFLSVQNDPTLFKYASDALKDDEEFVLSLCHKISSRYISKRLKNNKRIMAEFAKNDFFNLEDASERLQHDKKILLASMQHMIPDYIFMWDGWNQFIVNNQTLFFYSIKSYSKIHPQYDCSFLKYASDAIRKDRKLSTMRKLRKDDRLIIV